MLLCLHLSENGPYTINADMTLTENKFGWDVNSHMIFIDQPIGTGFSYSDVSSDMGVGGSLIVTL